MRLFEFIKRNQKAIIAEWENYAGTFPPAPEMSRSELRDDIVGLLEFIAARLEQSGTRGESLEKEKTHCVSGEGSAPKSHAEQRFRKGFDSLEMVSEFRVLRMSILKLWCCPVTAEGVADMEMFNEAIDQAMSESLQRYMETERRARTLFLGTLVHDLRNPLSAISQAAQILSASPLGEKESRLVSMIGRSSRRISQLISQLIDVVRLRLGKGLPVSPAAANMWTIAKEVVDEIRLGCPGRTIRVLASGDLAGEWDGVRIGQLISNLVGNAVQHGGAEAAVEVELTGEPESVAVSVHNTGPPIPPELLPVIFDPMARGLGKLQERSRTTSLGLGLFISHEIAAAHNGDISVASTEREGTTFTVRLPRKFTGQAVADDEAEDAGPEAET